MTVLYDRVYVTTSTTGTGTITCGSAVSGYRPFSGGVVANGATVHYCIIDGSAWELGSGTYSASAGTLTRSPIESSASGNAAINLDGNASVFITSLASDITSAVNITGGTIDCSATIWAVSERRSG